MVLAVAGCDKGQPPPPPQTPPQAPTVLPAPTAEPVPPVAPAQQISGAEQPDPYQELKMRVVARWDALVERNFDQAYTFETPSYRKVYDTARYKGKFGNRVAWLGARVNSVKDLGNGVAEVMVRLRYKAAVPIPGMDVVQSETNLKEKWVQEEGTWFHVTE